MEVMITTFNLPSNISICFFYFFYYCIGKMKLVKKFIEKDKSGYVALIAEDSEDMWHAYNLIAKGDHLKATTIR